MTPKHTERDFETAIEAELINSGGYKTWIPSAYDEVPALFPDDVSGFLKNSLSINRKALEALLDPKTTATVLARGGSDRRNIEIGRSWSG